MVCCNPAKACGITSMIENKAFYLFYRVFFKVVFKFLGLKLRHQPYLQTCIRVQQRQCELFLCSFLKVCSFVKTIIVKQELRTSQ
jgi:hypothetical protein